MTFVLLGESLADRKGFDRRGAARYPLVFQTTCTMDRRKLCRESKA